ncbi:MAG: thioredoxin family protein [Candidatus Paceibacterota bacterium]
MKKVILLKAPWCPVCPRVDELYREIIKKGEVKFDYEPLDVEKGKGLELAKKHGIYAIPTTIIDDKVFFRGKVPTKEQFLKEINA